MNDLLLKVHNLKKVFPVKASAFSTKKLMLKAIDGVSFDVKKGETLGLVGESGCGKTTTGRTILRLYESDGGRAFIDPEAKMVEEVLALDAQAEELFAKAQEIKNGAALTQAGKAEAKNLILQGKSLRRKGDILGMNHDLLSMPRDILKKRRSEIQMIFQDPWASLNPRMLVRDLIAEGAVEFGIIKSGEIDDLVGSLLDKVGLPRAAAGRYPHEFSGGQRQRISVARALAVKPKLIVCDEPVSALDVSIQAQVLNLLIELQEDFDLTYIFVAHDLSVVQYISDRVAVMYLGRIAELADSSSLYSNPQHPYTSSLLKSVPVANPDHSISDDILEGDVPSPVNPPSGCTFHPRCPRAIEVCSKIRPELKADKSGHFCSCHNPEK